MFSDEVLRNLYCFFVLVLYNKKFHRVAISLHYCTIGSIPVQVARAGCDPVLAEGSGFLLQSQTSGEATFIPVWGHVMTESWLRG